MRQTVVPLLRCAACQAGDLAHSDFELAEDGATQDGALYCQACGHWYPVEDGLLELLAGRLAYHEDRQRFWDRFDDRLTKLGLRPDADQIDTNAAELQAAQQQHFDWYANNTTQTYGEYEQTSFWQAADELAFEPWREEIRSGSRVLDVGSAQGRSSFKLMDLDIDIVGFDVSKNLVRQAIQRYRTGTHAGRATFFVADASTFPFVDEVFDYVLVYGVLHHLPDPSATCREVARVLKRGGAYFGSENNQTVFRAPFDLLQKIKPIWHEEAGPEALISDQTLRQWFQPTTVSIETTTRVFLPPHLINLLSGSAGYGLLRSTDRIGRAIPFIRDNGGLILVHGTKR